MIFLELDLVTKTNWKSSLYVWVRREELQFYEKYLHFQSEQLA